MSIYKKLFGYFLIFFSFALILLIGFPQVYSNNTAGRIEKSVTVESKFLEDESAKIVLLYFGYVGCKNICSPAMQEINTIYTQLPSSNISVYFMSLLQSDNDTTQAYAQYFNKDFKGINLSKKELQELKQTLSVQTSSSFTDATEINHAGHLYLLQRDTLKDLYHQKYIYTTRPFNTKVIVKDLSLLL